MVTVRELRAGLAVSTTSFVGSIQIGPLTIQINPKIGGRDFSALLGYALGLPNLELLPEHEIGLTTPAFQDLLVDRLTTEATRLVSRGLYRHYAGREALLASPRGRILFDRLARRGPLNFSCRALSLFRTRRECLGQPRPACRSAPGRTRGTRSCHSGPRPSFSRTSRRPRRRGCSQSIDSACVTAKRQPTHQRI
jgi:hypothetical protein